MFFIERLSKNIVCNIYNTSEIDENEREIMEYGVLVLLLKIIGILSVIIFGTILSVTLEALMFYFIVGMLRKYSGGIHSDSPNRCIIIGAFIAIIFPIFINRIYINFSFSLSVFILAVILIFCYYILLKLAPVDSVAKPIVSSEIRKKLKIKSLISIISMTLLLSILVMLYINYKYIILLKLAYCICFALLWQCFTLTNIGHVIMRKVDNILKYIIK